MRLGGILLALMLVGFVASLELSPTPIPLQLGGSTSLEGYELLVVWTSQEGFSQLVEQALSFGINVLVLGDKEELIPVINAKLERVSPNSIAVFVSHGRDGVKRLLLNTTPPLGIPLDSVERPSSIAVGIVVDVEYRKAYYLYYEAKTSGATLAVLTLPSLLETPLGEDIIQRLAPNGRIAWGGPKTSSSSMLALFHPATLIAFISAMVKSVEEQIEDPYMRLSYALLGIGLGLASLLPLLAGMEYGTAKAWLLALKACRRRGIIAKLMGPERCLVEED